MDIFVNDARYLTSMRSVYTTAQRVSSQLHTLASTAKRSLGVLTVGAGASLSAFSKFEYEMNRVRFSTNATAEEFETLKKHALDVGRTTQFSAISAAAAMLEFGKQGFTVQQILRGTKSALELAVDAQIDMGLATRLLSGVMRDFGKTSIDLGRITDVMTKIVLTGSTDMSLLANAIKYVGPVARASGDDIETMVAAVQILARSLIRGEEAGTALRSIMLRLQTQPRETGKALEAMGITVSDARGRFKGLQQILKEIEFALKGVNDEERNAIITRIAGVRAFAAMSVFINQGSEEFAKYKAALSGVSGLAERLQKTQLASLWGQLLLVKNQAVNLAIVFGEFLKPTIVLLTTSLGNVVKWLEGLRESVFAGIATFVAFAAAVSVVLVVMATTVGILVTLASPIGIVITLIASLMAGIVLLGVRGDSLSDKLRKIRDWFVVLIHDIKPILKMFTEVVVAGFAFAETAVQNWQLVLTLVMLKVRSAVVGFVKDIEFFFVERLPTILGYLVEYWKRAFKDLKNYLTGWFSDIVKDPIYELRNSVSEFIDETKAMFTGRMKAITGRRAGELARRASKGGLSVETERERHLRVKLETQSRELTEEEQFTNARIKKLQDKFVQMVDKRTVQLFQKVFGSPAFIRRPLTTEPPERPGRNREVGSDTLGFRARKKTGETPPGGAFTPLEELARKIQIAASADSIAKQQLYTTKDIKRLAQEQRDGIRDNTRILRELKKQLTREARGVQVGV